MKDISELKQFYDTIEHVYTFFGHSIKRWAMLEGIISSDGSPHPGIRLKRLCPTRWSSRYDSLAALRYSYVDVMKALTKISLTSETKDERSVAAGLKKEIEKFNFIFLVVLQTKILESVNVVSKLLQDPKMDIMRAVSLLENAIKSLTDYRNAFEEAKTTAQTLANKWGGRTQDPIQLTFQNVRGRRVKRHFDELAEDQRLSNAESYFRVNIFYADLDIIINQMTQRFNTMRATSHMFEALHPATLQPKTPSILHLAHTSIFFRSLNSGWGGRQGGLMIVITMSCQSQSVRMSDGAALKCMLTRHTDYLENKNSFRKRC